MKINDEFEDLGTYEHITPKRLIEEIMNKYIKYLWY